MKKVLLLYFLLTLGYSAISQQNMGIGTSNPDPSSLLELNSVNQGLLIPRMTEAQKNSIASPATGLLIYQTNNQEGFWYFDGNIWVFSIGPAGPTGPTGLNGSAGLTGPTGPAGTAGAAGATGSTGSNGVTGPTGSNGATGSTGSNGATGPSGADGATGVTGTPGATGPSGAVGATGATGTPGSTGPSGADGATGATGTNGTPGATGPSGANGANGTPGATGPSGADGVTGATGANGTPGATGPSGATGANGTPGATGPSGANGTTGTTGATGATGPGGSAGATGPSGLNGASGITGPTGPTGTTGQGITSATRTSEVQHLGNNTGSFSSSATTNAGYTPGTFQSTGLTATRTITSGSNVLVTFTGEWRTDFLNFYETELIVFIISRNGTEIGRTSAWTSEGGVSYNIIEGNVSLTVNDSSVPAGSNTYTVEYWMANSYPSNTESFFLGYSYLNVIEIRP